MFLGFYAGVVDAAGVVLPEVPFSSSTGRTSSDCCGADGYGKCVAFAFFRPPDRLIGVLEEQLHEGDTEFFRRRHYEARYLGELSGMIPESGPFARPKPAPEEAGASGEAGGSGEAA
ncbi:hypothetical protein N7540_001290 [Penicillium herquei]|nr:hypothetical protein N7540_001290 [Penicillium herquei]